MDGNEVRHLHDGDEGEDAQASDHEPVVIRGSEIYEWIVNQDTADDLTHKVWDGTPWIVDAFTGRIGDEMRDCKIIKWCRDNFGEEAWPIHGKPGDWHRGGATVMGWTWIGFKTEEMMHKFIEAWPAPEGV